MAYKCNKCRYHHSMLRGPEAPYGEDACLKTGSDLWGSTPEDVADCTDFEPIHYPREEA